MKNKMNLIIVLIILTALLLNACTGIQASGTGSASAASVTSQGSGEYGQITENESQQITQPVDTESADLVEGASLEDETIRPEGWSVETHSNEADPDYDVVFPQDEVNRLDITISPENWQVMLADMTSLYGAFGNSARGSGTEQGGQRGQNQLPAGEMPPVEGQPPNGEVPFVGERPLMGGAPNNGAQDLARGNRPAGGANQLESDESNPIWVPVTINFENDTWTNVGLRFKGNSSLKDTWNNGSYKLPLKLDFDEFEDDYAEIDDQRFYGFKQLSLSSNFKDSSLLHEKVAADIFRESGVPAAQTAFYQVYVDYGEGPVYFGLYTMVEVIDDTVIETQFEDGNGNVYKPSGAGATFAAGSFSEASFDKETNQDEADYSDILALYQALHAENRISDPETWRAGLESVFDVSGFLQYLAVNTVIQNWDTYGVMSHNYYLYNDPETGLLTWIPWDNNEAFNSSNKRSLSLSLNEVNANWPLIRYLMDDPVYQAAYASNIESLINGAFNPDTISARYQELHDLIYPYVVGLNGEVEGYTALQSDAAFDTALDGLIEHAESRYQAANVYLESIR